MTNVSNYAALRLFAYSAGDESVYVEGRLTNGDGGEGFFYWSGVVDVDNDGTIIETTVSPVGAWKRVYDGYIDARWFGAIPDYNKTTFTGTDSTVPIQNAINFASKKRSDQANVYIPVGNYMVSQLIIPWGMQLIGESGVKEDGGGGTVLWQKPGSNLSVLKCNGNYIAGKTQNYWSGTISSLTIRGHLANTAGFGITFGVDVTVGSVTTYYPSALQDTAILEKLSIVEMPSGGIELPDGGSPGYLKEIKLKTNGGPGVTVTKWVGACQSLSFINVSGDANIGGLIKISGYDETSTFVFVNLKGENGNYNTYSKPAGTIEQQNFIVLDGGCTAMLSIHGACNQPTVKSPDNINNYAIGDLILRTDNTKNPKIFWNGVNFRYNTAQVGAAPKVLSGTDIAYTQFSGQFNHPQLLTTSAVTANITDATLLSSSTYKDFLAGKIIVAPNITSGGIGYLKIDNSSSGVWARFPILNASGGLQASNLLQLGTTGAYSPSNTVDVNTITASVAAFINSASTNIPPGGGAGNLLSLGQGTGFSSQLYMKIGADEMYFRRNNGGFLTWRRVFHDGMVIPNANIPGDTVNTATDNDYTITSASQFVKLPTVTANRVVTLPGASANAGKNVTVWNQNTAGVLTWSFAANAKDAAGSPITTLTNSTVYSLKSDGTDWIKVN